MKRELIDSLQDKAINLSKNNRKIASYLLKHNPSIKRIIDIQSQVNVSLSSAHRFVKAIGYPTFTHFLYDYNEYSNLLVKEEENDSYEIVDEIAKTFGRVTKGKKIYIITSRRAKSLGKFFLERLNDGKIPCLYYSESKMQIGDFLKKTQNAIVLVFDLSSHSYILEKTNEILEDNFFDGKQPKFLLVSASSSKIVKNYKYHFSIGEIENKNYAINNWHDYNDIILKLFEFLHKLLKYIHIYNKKGE